MHTHTQKMENKGINCHRDGICSCNSVWNGKIFGYPEHKDKEVSEADNDST